MNLGNALLALGEREEGAARLEEAIAAYRAALEVQTREHMPLDWARTQNNLGVALETLGEREEGTGRLFDAVAAYGAALGERTREQTPIDHAVTQKNLARTLATISERTGQSPEEALAAIDAALEVFRTSGADSYVSEAEAIRRRIAADRRSS